MPLEFEDESFLLRRCFFEVQNEVGLGRQEEAYHQACRLWLAEQKLPVASKPPQRLMLRGEEAHVLYPDFVGWDSISVELKSVPRHLGRREVAQLFDYLKCRNDRLGLLVNMGLDRVEIERFVYSAPQTQLHEDWKYWTGQIDGRDRELGMAVREALTAIYSEHTTGYGEEVLGKLVLFALEQQRLSVLVNPVAKAIFHNTIVDESPLDCFVIENRIVLTVTALFDTVDFARNRGLSYMQTLGLKWGVAADFGKHVASICALRRG